MILEPDSWYVYRTAFGTKDGKAVPGWKPVLGKDSFVDPSYILDGPFPDWVSAEARCKDYVAARDVLQE